MRWRGDNWHLRLMGMLFGIGALALGLPSVMDHATGSAMDQAERYHFGMIASLTGLIALIGSLVIRDIRDLWYCNPERSKNARLTAREAAISLASLKPGDALLHRPTSEKRDESHQPK